MADSIKAPLFVEFYGLPGCGKSTISHIVARWLRNKGISVDEPSFDIDHTKGFRKKLQKLLIGVRQFVFKHNLYKKANEIVKKNGYNGKEAFTQTVNILQKILGYRNHPKAEVVIWDQGLIQAAISLSIKGNIRANENYNELCRLTSSNVDVLRIYIDVPEIVALKRMSLRPSNDSRIEKLSSMEEKLAMLHSFSTEIDSIRQIYKEGNIVEDSDYLNLKAEMTYQYIKNRMDNI